MWNKTQIINIRQKVYFPKVDSKTRPAKNKKNCFFEICHLRRKFEP